MKRSSLLALAIVVAVSAWVGLGMLYNRANQPKDPPSERAFAAASQPANGSATAGATTATGKSVIVTVQDSVAELKPQDFSIQGQLAANRTVVIRAETASTISQEYVKQGSYVAAGQALFKLATESRTSELALAQTKLEDAKRIYASTQRLFAQDYLSKNKLEEARLGVKQAEAQLALIRQDIGNTTISAPFAGVLDAQLVHMGDYVSPGQPLITIVDNSPLIATFTIAQQQVANFAVGKKVRLAMPNGETLTASIRFIAPQADSQTRTYAAEAALDAPTPYRAGQSVQILAQAPGQVAHQITPAAITLDGAGTTSVKYIDEQGAVQAQAVKIIKAENQGVWVTGLPPRVKIVKFGGDYVTVGSKPQYKVEP